MMKRAFMATVATKQCTLGKDARLNWKELVDIIDDLLTE
jgi:hypothetical protein